MRHADRRIVAKASTRSCRSDHRSALPDVREHPVLPTPVSEFRALLSYERSYLLDWQTRVRAIGIDAVQDLVSRRWPCPIADTIIGVYQLGDELASWLVIGHAGWWAVSCCDDGTVSQSLGSLADALTLVYQLGLRQLGPRQLGIRQLET